MKNQLLKGTLILTIAGLITRLIGFGYRVFLANVLGDTKLGIYQLIFPVYSICFTLYGAGLQTAVSQMISHEKEDAHPGILKTGMGLSFVTAVTLSFLLYHFSDWTGTHFLGTKETASLLRILAAVFPFCGVTAVINGYFYGVNDAKIPAITQILEQLCRVGVVIVLSLFVLSGSLSGEIAVTGLVIGEIGSHIYSIRCLCHKIPLRKIFHSKRQTKPLLALTLPLSSNKMIIALLGSLESVLIPVMLCRYGFSNADALAVYGILTGVVLPFVLFPGTITNSLSVLLLPAISRAAGNRQYHSVRQTTGVTVRYSLLLGILTSSVFLNYGRQIGTLFFHSDNAGRLLTALSFLCPFLYVSTTLTSVINGLGKTGITFLHTVIGLLVRLIFLMTATPSWGIYGYLFGIIISQILMCLLNGRYLVRKYQMEFQLMNHFVWPMIFTAGIFYIAKTAGRFIPGSSNSWFGFVPLVPACLFVLLYMWYFHLINPADFSKKA